MRTAPRIIFPIMLQHNYFVRRQECPPLLEELWRDRLCNPTLLVNHNTQGNVKMAVLTSRSEFANLTDLRMKEAKHLLDQKEGDGAYYLAGYAVEFALKARIISQLMKSSSFPEKKQVEGFYRHDLTVLRKLAELDDEMSKDATVSLQWDIVKDWSEQSRYEIGKTDKDAMDLYNAIEKGVLPWVKARW